VTGGAPRPPRSRHFRRSLDSRRWSRSLLAVHTVAVYLFLYLPIGVLGAFSFNSGRQTAVWEGFTLAWYGQLLRDERLLWAVRNSLVVATLATVLATMAGTMAALALDRPRLPGRAATRTLLLLPVILPEVVLGAALLTLFGAVRLRLSLTTVLAAHVVFSISYVAVVVRARLAGLDPALAEAARDLGAGGWEAFRRVTLPLALPGIAAGALLAFTLSIDDYVITSFVAGVGATTLPLHIYSMLKVGVTPEVNAISAALLVVTAALIAAAHWLLSRGVGSAAP
jgi:spermidine/putrescine transport system permease protein